MQGKGNKIDWENMTFEKAMERLEEIVRELETGEFDLDRAIEIFEEGIQLSKFCKKKLDEAEQKVEIIVKKGIEELVEKSPESVENESKDDYELKLFNPESD